MQHFPSVTLRCLLEDLGFTTIPPPEIVPRCQLDHPLIAELVRLAPDTPTGQKAIGCLHNHGDSLPAFRVRHSVWRGATWHAVNSPAFDVVWLLAGAYRNDGSPDDAYDVFEALHDNGQLRPTPDDWAAAAVERVLVVDIPEASRDAIETCRDALGNPGVILTGTTDGTPIAVVAEVVVDDYEGIAELTVGFIHGRTATQVGEQVLHTLILEAIAEALGFAFGSWEEGWNAKLPQEATRMYNATLKLER